MAKKSDYSLFINFFFNSLKIGLSINFRPSSFTIYYIFGSLFTIHYKKWPLFTNHYTPSRLSYHVNARIKKVWPGGGTWGRRSRSKFMKTFFFFFFINIYFVFFNPQLIYKCPVNKGGDHWPASKTSFKWNFVCGQMIARY